MEPEGLITDVEEREERTGSIPEELPILPVKGTILFPGMILPLSVGMEKSVKLVDDVVVKDKMVGIAAVKEEGEDYPSISNIHTAATAATVVKMIRTPDGGQNVLVQGLARIKILDYIQREPYYKARVQRLEEVPVKDIETDALMNNARNLFKTILEKSSGLPQEISVIIHNIDNPSHLADIIAANLNVGLDQKQQILELADVKDRLKKLTELLNREIEVLELSDKIQSQVKSEMDERQREYYLREQLKAIQKELGEGDERTVEIEEIKKRIEEAMMPPEVEKEALKELDRLSKMPPAAAEYTVSRTYLDWLVELPWNKGTEDNLDIAGAERILDEDHYDLEKVKKRVLEYLAVRKLKPDMKGPILCFAGPPGVGKTSLGMSIARALGRKFIRMSLGGMRDEAEIRGHRRTYVGALPGRIIQGIRKAGSYNPVFMLDEVDKLGTDFRGDPSSALLEVLDPEQNFSFMDHYLGVEYDLSRVMFIVTANILDTIPAPLRDRMEVLELPGYTLAEKVMIARKYLIPKQLEEHGLKEENLTFEEEAVRLVAESYTREAGVRNLERQVATICRGVAKDVASGKTEPVTIKPDMVHKFLGSPRFFYEVAERTAIPGVAIGMAWTPTGGDILFVEASKMRGDKRMQLTGQLGDVMKESAQAALSYIRSNPSDLGIEEDFYDNSDVHIHVPAGAIPKDGPSAGITIFTALVSLFTGKPVKSNVAMTGEITLRGMVLPVGGIKEKVLAAKRSGIDTIILPERNAKDLEEIPEKIREGLKFHFVKHMSEVIDLALTDGRAEKGEPK